MIYDKLTATAARLLLKYGQPVALSYTTGEVVNPATGAVTTPGSTVNINANGASTKFSKNEIDGEAIKRTDIKLILEQVATAPTTGWTATLNSVDYRVMSVMPVSPGGTDVIYICQLRV